MEIVRPTQAHLASFVAALETGWSVDTHRGAAAAREELADPDRTAAAGTGGAPAR